MSELSEEESVVDEGSESASEDSQDLEGFDSDFEVEVEEEKRPRGRPRKAGGQERQDRSRGGQRGRGGRRGGVDPAAAGGGIVIITSQAGSVEWRFTQNPEGHDYGHHMSRAACNIGGVLLAEELKSKGIPVLMLHPGFNKTGMTSKYAHIWEVEGAVDAAVGAKRVLHEVKDATMERTGQFINCEDGLQIPW